MSITSAGVGSGLDINSIITQLMDIEREPLTRLDADRLYVEAQISAYGQIRSSVASFEATASSLSEIRNFTNLRSQSSNSEVITASADENAGRGSYNLEVLRTADNHRLASDTTYAATSDAIGVGGDTMTIGIGGDDFTVDISGKTLAEVRTAINDAADNTGVTASIINDDAGFRLLLVADDTGSDNAITTTYSGADPFTLNAINADRDESGGFTSADLDAVVVLEGQFTSTSSSNTVDDLIEGVSLTLNEAGTATVSLERDFDGVKSLIGNFVNAYNALQSTISGVRDASLRADASPLSSLGDQFRTVLERSGDVEGQFTFLAEIGVSVQTDGTLSIDNSFLDRALTTDFDGVANMFADAGEGVGARFTTLTNSLTAPGGLLDSQTSGLSTELRSLETRIESFEFRLLRTEENLRRQYGALDSLLAQLQQTSAFLTQQFSNNNDNGNN